MWLQKYRKIVANTISPKSKISGFITIVEISTECMPSAFFHSIPGTSLGKLQCKLTN